ncbi:MAG: type III polyketide synthase [Bryobacterales bacterium]|nr:type III polyketide synthase [Bryobacterales bacterium]
MRILSAASAFPQYYYPQAVLTTALADYWADQLPNPQFLRRLHVNSCVDGRYLARPMQDYYDLNTFGQSNDVWRETAERLGEQSLCCAIARAGIDGAKIGAIFFVSVTGISSPSIDSILVQKLGLPLATKRIPIFGLGCVAGAAGIARAADYVKAYPKQCAALVSVELCSLTLQRDDLTPANLISSGLFGDGAAAVVVGGDEVEGVGPQVVDTRSTLYPDTHDVMGWTISERGFRIVLSPDVPKVTRENLGRDVDAFLAGHDLTRKDIGAWILHTGGPKILEATEESLGITREDLATSWECLRKTGNLSSASVLCVLEQFLMNKRPAPGTWSILAAMGPAFCSEVVLLRW